MLPPGQDLQSQSLTVKTQPMRCMRQNIETVEPFRSCQVIWRPWIPCPRETGQLEKTHQGNVSLRTRQMSKGAHGFQHPVRLLIPKSRTEEYLSHLGKKVLASFPVQAALHFYNDDSSSEEEDEENMENELEVHSHSLDHRSHSLRENIELASLCCFGNKQA
uniref:Protein ripply3 n=1 Tax=Esox lucius TaxID=8010 RepID=A0AAY5KJ77_ESOLU